MAGVLNRCFLPYRLQRQRFSLHSIVSSAFLQRKNLTEISQARVFYEGRQGLSPGGIFPTGRTVIAQTAGSKEITKILITNQKPGSVATSPFPYTCLIIFYNVNTILYDITIVITSYSARACVYCDNRNGNNSKNKNCTTRAGRESENL